MKVDKDPMPVVDTNYVESTNINLLEIAKYKIAEDFIIINVKEATKSIVNKDDKVEATNDSLADVEMAKATKVLRVKFQEVRIDENLNLKVNMVDMNQNDKK